MAPDRQRPLGMTRQERITAAAIIIRDAVEEMALAEEIKAVETAGERPGPESPCPGRGSGR